MSVLDKLACRLGRRDEVPNQELARELASREDGPGVRELTEALFHEDQALRSDAIKALYEIGYLKPQLISPYVEDFLHLLSSQNNRMVWGAMIALSCLAPIKPVAVHEGLDRILRAMQHGSVITKDAGVRLLVGLATAREEYARRLLPILVEQLETCRPKDLARRAEEIVSPLAERYGVRLRPALEKRAGDVSPAQQARFNKVRKLLEEHS